MRLNLKARPRGDPGRGFRRYEIFVVVPERSSGSLELEVGSLEDSNYLRTCTKMVMTRTKVVMSSLTLS